jgi:hypothetical protein
MPLSSATYLGLIFHFTPRVPAPLRQTARTCRKKKISARIVQLWMRCEKTTKTPGNTRRLFSDRKAYAFRGNLAPRITDKDQNT